MIQKKGTIRRILMVLFMLLTLSSGSRVKMFEGHRVELPKDLDWPEPWRLVEATAYAEPLFPQGQLTYCETPVGWGTIAVDPKVIPLRSRVRLGHFNERGEFVYLFGGQIFEALDTGRLIKKNIIDIWMPSCEQAINWGRRTVFLKIIG